MVRILLTWGMFKETLHSLFEAYMGRWSSQTSSRDDLNVSCSYSQDEDTLFQDFDSSCDDATSSCADATSSSVKNELNSYMEENRLDRKRELDVLCWWKTRQFRYPILSCLAGDMLTIPISTVASEYAFSIAGRVLNQYRNSLLSKTVQALLCSKYWLFGKKDQDSSGVDLLLEDVLDSTNGKRICMMS